MTPLHGLFAPVTTPFSARDTLDLDVVAHIFTPDMPLADSAWIPVLS